MAKRKDVIIKAPPAVFPNPSPSLLRQGRFKEPSPEELISILSAYTKELEQKIENLEVSLETIANVACSLTWIMIDTGSCVVEPNTIGIFREVSDKMKNARMQIGEDKDRNVIVRLIERGPEERRLIPVK